jgi:hypothetical protein
MKTLRDAANASCAAAYCLGAALIFGSCTIPAQAHHSGAMFEPEKVITLEGTVKEFEYTNPHSWLYVTVRDAQGAETVWGFESEGPSALMRAGIKANALQPGDKVTVQTRPLRDGRPAGAWVSVTKTDGTVLNPRRPVPTPTN